MAMEATMIRKANAVWQGSGRDGTGRLTSASGVLSNANYGYKTRFENEAGTNPEELLAASIPTGRGSRYRSRR